MPLARRLSPLPSWIRSVCLLPAVGRWFAGIGWGSRRFGRAVETHACVSFLLELDREGVRGLYEASPREGTDEEVWLS